jgi:hypothetical protein
MAIKYTKFNLPVICGKIFRAETGHGIINVPEIN